MAGETSDTELDRYIERLTRTAEYRSLTTRYFIAHPPSPECYRILTTFTSNRTRTRSSIYNALEAFEESESYDNWRRTVLTTVATEEEGDNLRFDTPFPHQTETTTPTTIVPRRLFIEDIHDDPDDDASSSSSKSSTSSTMVTLTPPLPITFEDCVRFLDKTSSTSPSYSPPSSMTIPDSNEIKEAMGKIKADKVAKAIKDSQKLNLHGNAKTAQWECFITIFTTVLLDYSYMFEHCIDLSFNQHVSIAALQYVIDSGGVHVIEGDTSSPAITSTDALKFFIGVNRKIYSILVLAAEGHALEIIKRTPNSDGRQALFRLRADALKQTSSQVTALQKQIQDFTIPSTKSPTAALDSMQLLCKELDGLLIHQGSNFGDVQTKAAILSSLPSNYEPFRISRDQVDKTGETIDGLITSITNHFTSYIGPSVSKANAANNQKDAKEKANGAKTSVNNNNQQNNSKKLTRKEKAAAAKARKAEAKANANAATDGKKEPDCLPCREAGVPDGQRGHYFSECPTLKKLRAERANPAGRATVYNNSQIPDLK